ncbi:MAG: hypothetical protein P8Y70_02270 [Candidatus Lokiarchaeota archaeon]
MEIILLGLLTLGFGSFKENQTVQIYFFILFVTLGGLVIGLLFFCDSCKVEYIGGTLFYSFSLLFNISFMIYQIVGYGYILIDSIQVYKISNFPFLSKGLLFFTIFLGLPMLSLPFYIWFNITILGDVQIFSIFLILLIKCILLLKKPYADYILTDKIYYINIYHKSGILLYSYKFEQVKKPEIASEIWGNILIGINHILSEFIDSKGQINLLKTKNAEIIVNYNNKYSFAVLAITNKKSLYLEKSIEKFEDKFAQEYQRELTEIQDINKIINVSEFRKTNEIIEDVFNIFL